MNILVDDYTGKKLDEDYRVLQPGSLVVLTRQRPPSTGRALEWLLRCPCVSTPPPPPGDPSPHCARTTKHIQIPALSAPGCLVPRALDPWLL